MKSEYDDFFRNNFNTPLTPEEERDFKAWARKSKKDPKLETTDYDLRGFWKNGEDFAGNGHGTDLYKKPNHPSFSEESMYHGTPTPSGGTFVGGKWETPSQLDEALGSSRGTFTPSKEMLETTHPPEMLQKYFKKYEPDHDLVIPKGMNKGGSVDKPLPGNHKLI